MQGFFRIHSGLSREGPGDRASLDWALGVARPPDDARILDAGCGPGADIEGLLAHAPNGSVLALDHHAPFADAAAARFAGDARVRAGVGDMTCPDGKFDLIWCAGALYFLGVQKGLSGWRGHLQPDGRVVFSEVAWRVDAPDPAAVAFWQAYPAMTDADGVLERVRAAQYRVIASRFLSDSGWQEYYTPLAARIKALRGSDPDDDLVRALDEEQAELDMWQAHGGDYGYLQVVCEVA